MSTLALHVTLERADFALEVQHELALEGITALFGPSGSGKTTLLRVIAGLERSARGSVTFDGNAWQSAQAWLPPDRRGVGYVFQDGRLFPHLTVKKNLEFAARRATRGAIDFDAAVAAFDLKALLGRRPGSLSGGEQQRVAIARALLTSPRLLLMDEPLSSLDVGRKREILPLIEQLPRQFGVPVLYVTHNVDEVARIASHVLLLAGGRVAAYGTVARYSSESTSKRTPAVSRPARYCAHTWPSTATEWRRWSLAGNASAYRWPTRPLAPFARSGSMHATSRSRPKGRCT